MSSAAAGMLELYGYGLSVRSCVHLLWAEAALTIERLFIVFVSCAARLTDHGLCSNGRRFVQMLIIESPADCE
jgi:hypothetical protein